MYFDLVCSGKMNFKVFQAVVLAYPLRFKIPPESKDAISQYHNENSKHSYQQTKGTQNFYTFFGFWGRSMSLQIVEVSEIWAMEDPTDFERFFRMPVDQKTSNKEEVDYLTVVATRLQALLGSKEYINPTTFCALGRSTKLD